MDRRVKPRANERNIVGQQLPTLLDVNVMSVCTPFCMLLDVVGQSLKPLKLLATQKRTLGVVGQQCCIRLHRALPHLSRLPHLPGIPNLHVNKS